MNSAEAKSEFESLLLQSEDGHSAVGIIRCMCDFYRECRVVDCRIEEDGDMLLYQWGTYDWGQGRWFELNITRQFIPSGGDDEDIFQLSATAKYCPSPELDSLKSGNKWCCAPDELPDFERFIREGEVFKVVGMKKCDDVEVTFVSAG